MSEKEKLGLQFFSVLEADSVDIDKGIVTIDIIEAGFNSSQSRFYPKDVLKRDMKVFEGLKMYANHQTEMEEWERPEGDVDKWVGNILEGSLRWVKNRIQAKAAIIDEGFLNKLRRLKENGLLKKMGTSIRAFASGMVDKVDDIETKVISSLDQGISVDFVTEAGAGGKVLLLESAKTLTIDSDKNNERSNSTMDETMKGMLDAAVKERKEALELLGTLKEAEKERNAELESLKTELKESTEALEKLQTEIKESAAKQVKESIKESGLTEAGQKMLSELFTTTENPELVASTLKTLKEELGIKEKESSGSASMGNTKEKGEEKDEKKKKAFDALVKSQVSKGFSQEVAESRARRMQR